MNGHGESARGRVGDKHLLPGPYCCLALKCKGITGGCGGRLLGFL